MNMSTSEHSSSYESGWTMYFDQSSNPQQDEQRHCNRKKRSDRKTLNPIVQKQQQQEDEDDDDDLSMVSDASSGPRQQFREENCFDDHRFVDYSDSAAIKKRGKSRSSKQKGSNLDDTASSPAMAYSMIKADDNKQRTYTYPGSVESGTHNQKLV